MQLQSETSTNMATLESNHLPWHIAPLWSFWGQNHFLYNILYKTLVPELWTYLYFIITLLIYDMQSEVWINTYYMLKGFLKARRPPKVSNEMKCTNEKMICNTEDTNLSLYVPKTNVDHTIRSQVYSTLDHSATTPRA